MSGSLLNDLKNFKNNYEIITNNNIQLNPNCIGQSEDQCQQPFCKWSQNKCMNNSSLSNFEINETDSNNLKKILLTRKRMLDINYHKNDIKNKKIYTMFVFIIIIVLAMTIIHFKNSK